MRRALAALVLVGCASDPATQAPAPVGDPPLDDDALLVVPERSPASLGATFELSFPADPEADPVGLEGLTSVLVALAAFEGQERAAAYGATLEGFRAADTAGFRITGPAASLESLAGIVLDLALDPRLPGTELATLAERWRERLHAHPEAALEAARRWAVALAMGVGRPIGLAPTDAALATLNREDLVRLHRRLVRPDRWRVTASAPLSPALSERLASAPAPAGDAPRPCLAPLAASYLVAGDTHADVVAALAPPEEIAAWRTAAEVIARHPSLTAPAPATTVEARLLGPHLVLVVNAPDDAAAAWQAVAPRLGRWTPLPAGLAAPAWVHVRLGTGDGLGLRPDGASCRR